MISVLFCLLQILIHIELRIKIKLRTKGAKSAMSHASKKGAEFHKLIKAFM